MVTLFDIQNQKYLLLGYDKHLKLLQNWQSKMLNYKQLYQANNFQLPEIQPPQLNPFPQHPTISLPDPTRDSSIAKLFKNPEYHFMSFKSSYSNQFERLCAKQNLYPFMIGLGVTKLVVVCKDCLMVSDWKVNQLGRVYEGGDDLVVVQKWQKVKLNEIPSAIKVGRFGAYLGFQSGRISQYVFKTKAWEGSNEELQFPVMRIQVLSEQEGKETAVLGLDSAGNIVHIVFSHKTFMDKIIKTLSSAKWVSFVFRNKKRQKIKKLFKNLMKNQTETQSGSTETMQTASLYTHNKLDLKHINNDILIAVFRRNILELLVLNKQYELIKTIVVDESHKDEKDVEVGFVQLGEGGFENANTTHNILVLGIGYTIHYYRIIQIQQSYEVVKVSQVQVQGPLVYGSFISNNLIAIGDRHQLYLSSIGSKPQSLVSLQTMKFSYIDFFMEQNNLQVDKQLFLSNLFCLLNDKSSLDKLFMGLQGKRLIVGKIFSWNTILQKLIYESKWQFAICCFQNIYNLQFKLCCGVSETTATRNSEMQAVCLKITKGYIQSHLPALKSNPYSDQSACFINDLIYFLLKCEQPQVLFQQAQFYFKQHELEELFLQELSRYIDRTNCYGLKLPFVSQKYLKLIINRYKTKGKQYLLEQLFMAFDLTQMERLSLLTTCLHEGLYRSLISICCEQKDYITPIIKLCGIGFNNPTKQRRLGEIIFWYLGECLNGRMTEFGNEQQYLNMLTILLNFMFIPSSVEMLLAANHKYMISAISLFFQPRIMRFILQNETRFFMRKDFEEGSLFQQNCLSQFRLYQRMLLVLIGVIEESKQQLRNAYQEELNRFLIPLMLRNHFPFLAKFKINIIRYFIGHPLLYVGGQEFTQESEIEVNGQLMRLLDSLIRSISEKCLNLRQKIKQDPETITQLQALLGREKENELSSILELMMLSPFSQQFSETKCYIYHQLGQYSTVLENYLKMGNKRIRTKLFSYLQNNLNQFSQLTQEFLKYLLSLLRIDQQKTIKLLWCLRPGWVDQEEVIDKLVDYPAVQLAYIQKVLTQGGDRSKKLLLRHLEIVLRQKSEQVESFISKIDYPLQQAFKMCEEHNNRMGKACILIKSGRNMEGVIIISQIFLEAVRQYLSLLRKGTEIQINKKHKIMTQFRVVLQTCQKEWLIDNDRGEDIWEKNTELIFRKMGVYNIDSPHIPESIREFLHEIISQLLLTMFQQVSTDFFFNRFAKTFSSLPIRIFFQAYKYIQNRLQFSFTIQKLNTELLQQEQVRTWKKIMSTIYHAHICTLICDCCAHAITNNEKMVSYGCKHMFHQECYYEQNSKKSKNELCPLCFTGIENYIICAEAKPLRYRVEVDEKELLRVKMGRMNYYDRTSQLNAMENWSKFQEWVDL